MADVEISWNRELGVKIINLNRPKKKNPITSEMYGIIGAALISSNTEENTKLNVITGTGEYFCAGTDLNVFTEMNSNDAAEAFEKRDFPFVKMVKGLIECRKPIIALVNGPAVGIGVTLLGLCDVVYATDRATFSTPFGKLGFPPECCSSYTFPKIMGYVKSYEFFMLNRKMSSEDAYRFGLVTEVFPHEKFQTEAWNRVKEYSQFHVKNLMDTKEVIRGPERAKYYDALKIENEHFDPELIMEAQLRRLQSKL